MTAIHLVGGFLGAGKTTAIIQASKTLMRQGKRVGVITNDQGKYLVDTAYYRAEDIPAVEVTGGCFCCHYTELDEQIQTLLDDIQPDVLFAESVGSCADIVATVLNPLNRFRAQDDLTTTYSAFTDARLLQRYLRGEDMPFSEDVVYLFGQQLEESGMLVINKSDLLSKETAGLLREMAANKFPGKPLCLVSTLTDGGLQPWMDWLSVSSNALPLPLSGFDYERYTQAELKMAWADLQFKICRAAPSLGYLWIDLIGSLLAHLHKRSVPIAHLKIVARAGGFFCKTSITSQAETDWKTAIPAQVSGDLEVTLNLRVELPAVALEDLLNAWVASYPGVMKMLKMQVFQPGKPRATHRMLTPQG